MKDLQRKKGDSLFKAALNLEETWNEIERLVEVLNQSLNKSLGTSNNQFATLEQTQTEADRPQYNYWAYQYNFDFFKKGPGKKKVSASLHFEFRLCWPSDHVIMTTTGSEAQFPVIIVKAKSRISDVEPFECYDLLSSPSERVPEQREYSVHDQLLWYADEPSKCWAAAFVTPLFTVEETEDVERELIGPSLEILKSSYTTGPDDLAVRAFKKTQETLVWMEDSDNRVLLRLPDAKDENP